MIFFLGNYDTDDKLWDQKPKNHGLSELRNDKKKHKINKN